MSCDGEGDSTVFPLSPSWSPNIEGPSRGPNLPPTHYLNPFCNEVWFLPGTGNSFPLSFLSKKKKCHREPCGRTCGPLLRDRDDKSPPAVSREERETTTVAWQPFF